jgi:hypothetical protein
MEKPMKTTKTAMIPVLALVTLLVAVSCGSAPEEEMNAATQAVEEAASNPDVEEYAPQSLAQARELLAEMETAAENEEYDRARSLAEQASTAAEQAVRDAATVKSRARDRAESAIESAGTALEDAREALSRGRDVQGIDFDFQAAESELDGVSDAISSAEADLADENFAEAQATAEDARSTLSALTRRLSDATQAASRK